MPINKKRKLGPKTVDCVFLGYAMNNMGYKFIVVKSGVPEMAVGTIFYSRDATVFESEFPMKNKHSTSSHESVIPHEHFSPIIHNEEPLAQNPEEDDNGVARKSKR